MPAKTIRLLRCDAHPQIVALFGVSNSFLLFVVIALVDWEFGPALFFGIIPVGTGLLWLFSLHAASRFRLRLLADGMRMTELGQTTEVRHPELIDPSTLSGGHLKLRADERTLHLDLSRFESREQALIIEHLSQFLTPEQQAKQGRKWATWYAERITVPKPNDPWDQFLSIWWLLCVGTGCCIVCIPILLGLAVHAEEFSPVAAPEFQKTYYEILALTAFGPFGLLLFGGAMFVPYLIHVRFRHQIAAALVALEWSIKDSKLTQCLKPQATFPGKTPLPPR